VADTLDGLFDIRIRTTRSISIDAFNQMQDASLSQASSLRGGEQRWMSSSATIDSSMVMAGFVPIIHVFLLEHRAIKSITVRHCRA